MLINYLGMRSILLPPIFIRSNYLISKGAVSCRKDCYRIVNKFVTTLEASLAKESTGICYQITNFNL